MDTNAIIDYLAQKMPTSGMGFMNRVIDALPNVSVITKIEVLGFTAPQQHYRLLEDFMDDVAVLELTDEIVKVTINIRKEYKKTKLPDAIIAATAIVNNLILITRNTDDFSKISKLEVVNAHEL